MPVAKSSMLVFLAFIAIVVTAAAAVYLPSMGCASIEPYFGSRAPSGKIFDADQDICKKAIGKVMNRTPNLSEAIGTCGPHLIMHRVLFASGRGEVVNLVRCPAHPAAVWVKSDALGYWTYYVPHEDDMGCNSGDAAVAAAGYALGEQALGAQFRQ